MPRTRPPYPPEFRREAIRLVRASDEKRPIPKGARELGPRKRADAALVPEFRGVLETDDGGVILFEWQGLAVLTDSGMLRLLGSLLHTTDDPRYRWLNDRVCAVEGEVRPRTDGSGSDEVVFEVSEMVCSEEITTDIHCVTKWSKLDTRWEGVSVDTLLEEVETAAEYIVAFCDGGYTTNLPLDEVTGGKAWIAYSYGGEPLEPEHGGPARLLVPRLYFWKSAKWVQGLRLVTEDEPGFWESLGYHNYGDPWREQRYWGD